MWLRADPRRGLGWTGWPGWGRGLVWGCARSDPPAPQVFKPRTPVEAISLCSRLLEYTPATRLSPLEACTNAFFSELREPNARLPSGRDLPPLFNFSPVGECRRRGAGGGGAPGPSDPSALSPQNWPSSPRSTPPSSRPTYGPRPACWGVRLAPLPHTVSAGGCCAGRLGGQDYPLPPTHKQFSQCMLGKGEEVIFPLCWEWGGASLLMHAERRGWEHPFPAAC